MEETYNLGISSFQAQACEGSRTNTQRAKILLTFVHVFVSCVQAVGEVGGDFQPYSVVH